MSFILSIFRSNYLSIYLSINISIYLSINLAFFLFLQGVTESDPSVRGPAAETRQVRRPADDERGNISIQ